MFGETPFNLLDSNEKLSIYARMDNNFIDMEAIFSDCTENFVRPVEPHINDNVTIKIRVALKDADAVFLINGDVKIKMTIAESDELFDYYTTEIRGIKEVLVYYFEIHKAERKYTYNRQGVTEFLDEFYNFKIIPGFITPSWAKGAVMYQIYVDRFSDGDPRNNVVSDEYKYLGVAAKHIKNWEEPVEELDICNFYGGDLLGVIGKMGYLKNLGVEAIYFNPLFVSPSNHKYDIQDYDYIDPHIGVIIEDGGSPLKFEKFNNNYATMYMQRTTNQSNLEASNRLFIKLVEIAHSYNIKIILDGVFNHCGAFNKWMDRELFYSRNGYEKGAYESETSLYHSFFNWLGGEWPFNENYDGWWGHSNHPKLNFENSRQLEKYILNVAKKWVSPPYNADGWRLDVAADLGMSEEYNHEFWKKFRTEVKNANKDAVIIAEHYGDPSSWLLGDQWDTIMNYDAFMEPLTWFLTGVDKHSEVYKDEMYCNDIYFLNSMKYNMARLPSQSLMTAMNQLSNHDHSRFMTRTTKKVGRLGARSSQEADSGVNLGIMMEAIGFQMCWVGSPTLYYGDEAGVCGWTDPDNRRTFPWGKENTLIQGFYKKMIDIHKSNDALRKGSTAFLYSEFGIICFGRWFQDNRIVAIMNNNQEHRKIYIPVWKINVSLQSKMEILVNSFENGYTNRKNIYEVKDGFLTITLAPYSFTVLKEVVSEI